MLTNNTFTLNILTCKFAGIYGKMLTDSAFTLSVLTCKFDVIYGQILDSYLEMWTPTTFSMLG